MAQQKTELWRERFPRAQFTLLSASLLKQQTESNITHWNLPQGQKRELIRFAHQLRRARFRYAIVLSDNARGDVGYGEAKFWAFAANARWRDFEGKPLTIWREAKAKRKVALVWAARIATQPQQLINAPRRAETIAPSPMMDSARTFVYLQHAVHQHGVTPRRALLIGERWDKATALRSGWQVVDKDVEAELVLIEGWRDISKHHGGLFCFADLTDLSPTPKGVQLLEQREAFFNSEAHDIWLVSQS